jgi:nucleoside 2-deoxyribosyltransferase
MNVFISHSRADRAFAERLGSGIRALGANVVSDETRLKPGESFDHALREALEASDAVVLVVPEPRTAQANNAFFEAGAARALGKPLVAVLPNADPGRVGELPPDGLAVFDGSKFATEALAKSIVTALEAS